MKSNHFSFSILLILTIFTCSGQDYSINKSSSKNPNAHWVVHKEIDEHGNIIRLDSFYSWTSNRQLNHLNKVPLDSFMHAYKNIFKNQFPLSQDNFFSHFFSSDSTLTAPENLDNFFEKGFYNPFLSLDNVKKHLEALNQFSAPIKKPLIPAEKESKPIIKEKNGCNKLKKGGFTHLYLPIFIPIISKYDGDI